MPFLSPLITLLLKAFIEVSERVFLNWYDKAKDRDTAIKKAKDIANQPTTDSEWEDAAKHGKL